MGDPNHIKMTRRTIGQINITIMRSQSKQHKVVRVEKPMYFHCLCYVHSAMSFKESQVFLPLYYIGLKLHVNSILKCISNNSCIAIPVMNFYQERKDVKLLLHKGVRFPLYLQPHKLLQKGIKVFKHLCRIHLTYYVSRQTHILYIDHLKWRKYINRQSWTSSSNYERSLLNITDWGQQTFLYKGLWRPHFRTWLSHDLTDTT